MPYYTPLRYPGGKRRLINIVVQLLNENRLKDIEYAEPYAGGASIALSLLFEEYASVIHINDLSRPVYAFWHSVLHETSELCRRIELVNVTMDEWYRQRAIYNNRQSADLDELGFATLFLNRTNRSGIVAGGVIGGKKQTGAWSLDARFNKSDLVQRIRKIGRFRSRISIYQCDGLDFTDQVVSNLGKSSFVFYDPPYIENGKDLYLNDYTVAEHHKLARRIARLKQPWVTTYDSAAIHHGLFKSSRRVLYDLKYVAQARYEGKEVMFLSRKLKHPSEWDSPVPVLMSATTNRNPIYGLLDSHLRTI